MRVEMNERHGYTAESAVFCAVMHGCCSSHARRHGAVAAIRARGRRRGPLERTRRSRSIVAAGCVYRWRDRAALPPPRIIGYLVAGFIAGPAWLKVVRGPELQALDVISSGALTLIALAVGNELTLDPLRGERRTALLRIVGGAMAGPFLFVALVVLTVSPWFPLTAHSPSATRWWWHSRSVPWPR